MELAPVPCRPPVIGRLWLVVAAVALLPILLLVLVPASLGLHRYVVSSDAMAGSVPRGSLTFAGDVPASDLRVGDVITFARPGGRADEPLVTRRIAAIGTDGIRTASDGRPGLDPWILPAGDHHARMVVDVPLLGYPFLAGVDRRVWLLAGCAALGAVLLAAVGDLQRGRRRRQRLRPEPRPVALQGSKT